MKLFRRSKKVRVGDTVLAPCSYHRIGGKSGRVTHTGSGLVSCEFDGFDVWSQLETIEKYHFSESTLIYSGKRNWNVRDSPRQTESWQEKRLSDMIKMTESDLNFANSAIFIMMATLITLVLLGLIVICFYLWK